ncbi:MAG: hypothetical protein ACOYM2_10260 [Rectinemataceae bacterium]
MDAMIATLRDSGSTTMQALAVTAGGLIGVFTTLGLFFLIIWAAEKVGKKG